MDDRGLRFDRRANAEFDAAADWYEAQRAGLGQKFIDAVDSTMGRIASQPRLGTPVPGVDFGLGVRRQLLKKFLYAVVYLELDDEIVVVAIVHDHRKPGYWRERVRTR